jgi:guanylate kinase
MDQTPHLKNREAFEALLGDYHMSDQAQQQLAKTPFVLMLAPTATGRNTIINALLKTGHYYFVVSDTTRPPRVNNGVPERSGVEYYFKTEEEMLEELKKGRYIEAEIIHKQQVSGTSISELERARRQSKIAITDIEIGGTLAIAARKPDAVCIFVAPPSFEEWLRRLTERNNPAPQEVQRRMETAIRIFKTVLSDDRFICVINDTLADAVQAVDDAARLHNIDAAQQAKAHQLIHELLAKTEAYLQQHF